MGERRDIPCTRTRARVSTVLMSLFTCLTIGLTDCSGGAQVGAFAKSPTAEPTIGPGANPTAPAKASSSPTAASSSPTPASSNTPLASTGFCAGTPPANSVSTTSGIYSGTAAGGITSFLGIPYAAAPLGNLRWKNPQSVTANCNVQPATAFKPGCVQSNSSVTELVIAQPPKTDQSEDCLYANVYAPSDLSGKKPVLVWIYGGAYAVGYADKFYNAVYPQNGIVFVNFDYRVGIFGFFSHPGLDAENPTHTSGNQGLLDQVAALQWVRKNISQFGGDPNNVTIEGESAGGGSVGALVTSSAAKGLFNKAFGESVYAQAQPQYWTFPGLVDTQLSPLKMGAGVFNVSESQTEA